MRLLVCAILLSSLSLIALAQDNPATAPAPAPTTKPAASNTKCPVSGDAIDPKSKTVEYQGKTIAFCCDNCVEPFNKNPEKYAKNLK